MSERIGIKDNWLENEIKDYWLENEMKELNVYEKKKKKKKLSKANNKYFKVYGEFIVDPNPKPC